MSLVIFEERYKKMKFFNNPKQARSPSFIAWMCPLLHPVYFESDTYIYEGGDMADYIYFLIKGKCFFVLPEFNNSRYISIKTGDHFGIIDLMASNEGNIEDWTTNINQNRRAFTVMTGSECEILALSVNNLIKMQSEFKDYYNEFFYRCVNRFKKAK